MLSAIATRPRHVGAQQRAMPVIGFLRSTSAQPFAHVIAAFREGLAEVGLVEGRNVIIEQHWAEGRHERLPALASDLVRRGVDVIVCNSVAVEHAQAATKTIPIVFVVADDPVRAGFVTDLGRPTGNITGITFHGGAHLDAKRLELLDEIAPRPAPIAVLIDASYRGSEAGLASASAAGRAIRREVIPVKVASEREFDAAFELIVASGARAVMVSGSPTFTTHRSTLIALAARHKLPAIYDLREFAVAGGLMSYAASLAGAYREAGVYAGRIVKGAKPADLPVREPVRFDLVINTSAARALGVELPHTLLLRANEIIQ